MGLFSLAVVSFVVAAGGSDEDAFAAADVHVGGSVVGDDIGGATDFVFKRGVFVQADVGGFFVVGAAAGAPTGFAAPKEGCPDGSARACVPTLVSDLQPGVKLTVGVDVTDSLGVLMAISTGFVANAAVYDQTLQNPRDYGLAHVDVGVVGSVNLIDRLALAGRLTLGVAGVSPVPAPGEPGLGGAFGLGAGLRYATLLPNTVVGLDVDAVVAVVPASPGRAPVIIPAVSFAPVLQYVF